MLIFRQIARQIAVPLVLPVLGGALLLGQPAWGQSPPTGSTSLGGSIPGFQRDGSSRPLPINPERLRGLSSAFVRQQYRAYLNAFKAYQRLQGPSPRPEQVALMTRVFNRQYLLYRSLESLGGSGVPEQADSRFAQVLALSDQTPASWQAEVLRQARYLEGGTGWLIWEYNLISGTVGLYPALDESELRLGSLPLLVLDLNRAAYSPYFQGDLEAYLEALLGNLNGQFLERELQRLGLPYAPLQ